MQPFEISDGNRLRLNAVLKKINNSVCPSQLPSPWTSLHLLSTCEQMSFPGGVKQPLFFKGTILKAVVQDKPTFNSFTLFAYNTFKYSVLQQLTSRALLHVHRHIQLHTDPSNTTVPAETGESILRLIMSPPERHVSPILSKTNKSGKYRCQYPCCLGQAGDIKVSNTSKD